MAQKRDPIPIDEVLRLMAKNWEIMNALSKKDYFGKELADKLGKSTPEICLKLKNLREKGLVKSQQRQGERQKHFFLSDLGKRMFRAVTEAMQPEPEGKLEDWQISQLLDILGDSNISNEVRRSYSGVFHTLSAESPAQLVEHSGVRELIKKIVTDPPKDEVIMDLDRSVPPVLSCAVQHRTYRDWVLKQLYPVLVSKTSDESEKTRAWAVRQMGKIATLGKDPKLTLDARKKLLKLWFSDKTDATSDFGNEVKEQIVLIALHSGTSNAQGIFNETKTKVRDKDPKAKKKAEVLLESLKVCFLPKHGQTELDKNSTVDETAQGLGKYTLAIKAPT